MGKDFLDLLEVEDFIPAFRSLRINHIINDITSARVVEQDGIIPKCKNWGQALEIFQDQSRT